MDNIIKRIVATIIDFYIICFLSSICVGIFTLGEFSVTPFSVIMYFGVYFLLLLFKDFVFKNQSIGKRLFKLKVVKIDGTKLMLVDIVKRNIPITILVPVEVFMLLVNERRIGDIWAKTTVVCDDYESAS